MKSILELINLIIDYSDMKIPPEHALRIIKQAAKMAKQRLINVKDIIGQD